MNLRRRVLPTRRLIATLLAFASVALRAEQIKISKPAVEIAGPVKVEENLPETRSKRLDFGERDVAVPLMRPPQTIIRIQRQENDEDERFSPRGSKRVTDPSRRDSDYFNARNSFGARDARPAQPWNAEPSGFDKSDSQQALSPVMQFDWDARDSSASQRGSFQGTGHSTGRDAARKQPARDENRARNETFEASPFRDLFAVQPKEKPSRELVERRAAFERLLNPNAGMAGRSPGSLEPLTALQAPKSAPSIAIATPGVAKFDSRPTDPMQAFNVQHDRLRGPAMDDINKKYSTPAPGASSTPLNSRPQTPLNRQPTTREFPTRKF